MPFIVYVILYAVIALVTLSAFLIVMPIAHKLDWCSTYTKDLYMELMVWVISAVWPVGLPAFVGSMALYYGFYIPVKRLSDRLLARVEQSIRDKENVKQLRKELENGVNA